MSWIFTFGSNHRGTNGEPLGNRYVKIPARSHGEAKIIMVMLRGRKWSHQYESAEKAGVEEYNLSAIPMDQIFLPEAVAPRGVDFVMLTMGTLDEVR